MTAYGVLKTLIMPPGGIILLLAAAFFLVRGGLGRLLLGTATAILTLMSLPAVALWLMAPLEPFPALDVRAPLPTEAKAILLLGAGLESDAPEYLGNTVDGVSLERTRYAAWLRRATGLPIYVSGGNPAADEAAVGEAMARVLRDEFKVPVAGVDAKSQTTWENAAYSKPMLAQAGVTHVLLVTSAWHLPRAVEACERAGIGVTPAPTGFATSPGWETDLGLYDWLPSPHALHLSYYAIHEHLGRAWYQVRAWIEVAPRATPVIGQSTSTP
ncbi:MAG TPA: YdcF family protein [Lamprocystis sp. (in: g-proteobacteria)]|nr:YdcF family protein [Lamprocystis sp. (in: g-proteobacteria)]